MSEEPALGRFNPRVIEFTIPGVPAAQPRARATSVKGKARVYEPTKHPIKAFRAAVKLSARSAYHGPPLGGPLRVDVTLVFPRPKAMTWKTKPMPRVWHAIKPDRDNCDKAILDALSGLLWRDDCQVCAGQINKWVAAGDEQPHVVVRIEVL